MTRPDGDFPADPYPGAVPATSYVHLDATARPLEQTRSGWAVGGSTLDAWLARRGAVPTWERVPVLAYGSNRCPSKITWLRTTLGLGSDPVVVLRATTTGAVAVWAAGLRARDGQRPAVLAAAPGVAEQHCVWLATREQVAVLDVCEGRDRRFRLVRLHTGEVRTDDGALIVAPWCYTGFSDARRPLLVDGAAVRCADVGQAAALALSGDPATGDGLVVTTVVGAPEPDDWPAALFAYGLLRPGQESWKLVAPYADGPPHAATVAGTVHDTGQGYPAWLADGPGTTPGVVIPLRDPAVAFPGLDAYEGPEYQRVRVVTGGGQVCWAYAWRASRANLRPLPAG